ncbi:acyl carrier protein [Clostridium cavendishii DSM 21758]|uniref:Acyl carrier protein n=1 Tax=Clostridium cavendishii DSM 21758 TaxID=1121302 RepID=A0A1M6MU24_9CLOT|nr:phosphopantetheine-binding protein [Clostridium cavendishii]SHJ86906.1 acyl carrier protein [Clostridium cavendishii DSM 21758]
MDIRKKIIEIIALNSDIQNVREYLENNNDLTKLAINSISFIKIVVGIEKEFDFEFDEEELDFNKYVFLNMLCNYVQEKTQK